jgi:dCMP deaminase
MLMETTNLVAYIPVLNQRHLDWFAKHQGANLYLISRDMAIQLDPREARNVGAIPTPMMQCFISSIPCFLSSVWILNDDLVPKYGNKIILEDNSICREFAKRLSPSAECSFEMTWSRWDMSAVKRQQPLIPDCVISSDEIDVLRIAETEKIASRSPDLWRQIGVIAFRDKEILGIGWNEHFPTEYETDMFGDPRINFDAGDPAGAEVYLSLHAEEYLAGFCARDGISLKGASVYINTFPCGRCARMLSISGIKELFFREGSSFLKGFEILQNAGIKIVQVKDPESA